MVPSSRTLPIPTMAVPVHEQPAGAGTKIVFLNLFCSTAAALRYCSLGCVRSKWLSGRQATAAAMLCPGNRCCQSWKLSATIAGLVWKRHLQSKLAVLLPTNQLTSHASIPRSTGISLQPVRRQMLSAHSCMEELAAKRRKTMGVQELATRARALSLPPLLLLCGAGPAAAATAATAVAIADATRVAGVAVSATAGIRMTNPR